MSADTDLIAKLGWTPCHFDGITCATHGGLMVHEPCSVMIQRLIGARLALGTAQRSILEAVAGQVAKSPAPAKVYGRAILDLIKEWEL